MPKNNPILICEKKKAKRCKATYLQCEHAKEHHNLGHCTSAGRCPALKCSVQCVRKFSLDK